MIITRSWLQEYINLDDISNKELIKKFNEIGLEVDSAKEYEIPSNVVVGKVISCQKHPNADKLNICSVDVGESEPLQIVCGASNVVDARFVAVAKIGAILPGNFKIKKAKLREVESFGMICSSSELGLPEIEDGIMILDDSIGKLEIGKELKEYKNVNDLVIELELTANRGDALSILGVARDLSAAFKKELIPFEFSYDKVSKLAIAKELKIEAKDEFNGVVNYLLATTDNIKANFLIKLRNAFTQNLKENDLENILAYSTHGCGVILNAYDFEKLNKDDKNRAVLTIQKDNHLVKIKSKDSLIAILGAYVNEEFIAKDGGKILIEASYVEPQELIEGVTNEKLKVNEEIYYKASRGSEPNIDWVIKHIQKNLCLSSKCEFADSIIKIDSLSEPKKIGVNFNDVIAIIGNEISKKEMAQILTALGYKLTKSSQDLYAIEIPPHAHDIKNIHDIAEEILRIYGIDKIKSVPLNIVETNRINKNFEFFKAKKEISNLAVGAGFFEAITYAFFNKQEALKYGLSTLKEELDLINPIVSELNSLRTTIALNLIEAAQRNVKYGKKSVALFEIGTVFNENREEKTNLTFIFSGEEQKPYITNGAKAKNIDFASFVKKISSVIGNFELKEAEIKNNLMHPYQSAYVIKDGNEVGVIYKLHPKVAKDFDLSDTFLAEFDFEKIIPKHINAKEYSNYQPAIKDLSIVINKNIKFFEIAKVLKELKNSLEILKDFYPLDIYSDESLKDNVSLTIRFTLQSNDKTLIDEDIEKAMKLILDELNSKFGAVLR
jgi:phenylalanyl-tRNA synthetase beta chain